MNVLEPCPAPERLRKMLDDSRGLEDGDVEAHVTACKACQEVLERLTSPSASTLETCWIQPDDPASPRPLEETQAPEPRREPLAGAMPHPPGYVIERELGRGGMGVVYLAVQANPNRLVALKMIPAGRARDEDLVRFRLEGENLARLRHPNIVQVYDAGAVDGRPYFAMEYVPGGNLAASFALFQQSPSEAAFLVETLARAVHAAHQCGVVHRDLKPANILLDEGSGGSAPHGPKITDFGLAKRVGDDSGLTQTGQILGTPSYMAPEQASGSGPVGVAADVYSLGTILFEGLTGRPPFLGGSPWDTLMKVVHDPAPLPSRVRPGVPRDLEVICIKCLAKKPEDRYAGAEALAEDLQRWREGRPISARPAGPARRIRLWARRHPAYAALGSLLAASIVAGAVGVGVQWSRAEHHLGQSLRRLAQSRRRLALAMGAIDSFHTGVSGDVILKREELKDLRSSLLSTPLRYYKSLREEMEGDGELDRASLVQLVDVLSRLGKLNAEVGLEDDALRAYRQAAEAARRVLRDAPRDPAMRRTLADALIFSAEIDARTSQRDRARVGLDEALHLFEGLAGEATATPNDQDGRASCLHFLGDVECDDEHFERSEELYREAVAIREGLIASHPGEPDYLDNLGGTENNLAILYARWNRLDDAGRWFRRGLEARQRLAREHGDRPDYRRKLGSSLNNMGSFAQNGGRPAEALAYFAEALNIQEGLAKDHPTVALYQDDLATTHENLATLEGNAGRRERARAEYARALAIRVRLAADHPTSLDFQARLIHGQALIATDLLQDRVYGPARAWAVEAVAASDRAAPLHSGSDAFRTARADALVSLGDVQAASGRSAPAEAAYTAALDALGDLGRGNPSAEARRARAQALLHRGVARAEVGRRGDSEADLAESLRSSASMLEEQPGASLYRLDALEAAARLAECLLQDARHEESPTRVATAREDFEQLAKDLEDFRREEPDDDSVRSLLTRARVGRSRALEAEGRYDEALLSWDEALVDAPLDWRRFAGRGRAVTLCRAGRVEEGVARATATSDPGSPPETADDLIALARVHALAARTDGREDLAGEAVADLARAALAPERGDGLALLECLADRDFDPLRVRPDFEAVVQDLSFPDDVFAP